MKERESGCKGGRGREGGILRWRGGGEYVLLGGCLGKGKEGKKERKKGKRRIKG